MPTSKDEILDEIRRLAKANGIVPGRHALETEAGIKESDWRGVYWAKYSDAVKEAGLEPNKVTTAYPKEHLLESLAMLAMETKHVPTEADIRMKCRKEPGFPTGKTISRIGSKPERVAQLLRFCSENSKFTTVIKYCEDALAGLDRVPEVSSDATEGDGIVYLLKSGKRYKFGFTNDHERRIRELARQTAEPIGTVHSIRTDDPSGIEAYWKRRFADKCVHNEWFILTAKDVATFRRRKKFM